ncbi:MAG TPA: hemerythrin domain-containing protein [Azospirillum sp.]|nr:hemerythrin domain-containing protein [Azospirillum sp.]
MDIYDRIEQDHDTLRTLLTRIADAPEDDKAGRRMLFEQLQRELWAHHKVEETVFYATIVNARATREEAAEGLNEHHLIDTLLGELNLMPVDGTAWKAKVQVLDELVRHHLDEEEDELFKEARDTLPDETAQELARQFDERKAHAVAALAPLKADKGRSQGAG